MLLYIWVVFIKQRWEPKNVHIFFGDAIASENEKCPCQLGDYISHTYVTVCSSCRPSPQSVFTIFLCLQERRPYPICPSSKQFLNKYVLSLTYSHHEGPLKYPFNFLIFQLEALLAS